MAAIQTLSLTAGGAAVHVTVDYLSAGVSPQNVAWTLDQNLQAIEPTADATGFNFQAPVGMVPVPSNVGAAPALLTGNAVATDMTNGAVGVLAIAVTVGSLTFASP